MPSRAIYRPLTHRVDDDEQDAEKWNQEHRAGDVDDHRQPPQGRIRSTLETLKHLVVLLGLVSGACSLYHYQTYVRGSGSSASPSSAPADAAPSSLAFCPDEAFLPIQAPRRNIWRNLDVNEASAVRRWLFAPEQALNLTTATTAGLGDNTVSLIERWRPSKRDALAYLADGGGSNDEPERVARVTLVRGAESPPVIRDYLVGPLPISNDTQIRPLKEIYADDGADVPLNARMLTLADLLPLKRFLARTFGPLTELTEDLFGVHAQGLANDTMMFGGQAPMSFDGEWRRLWMPLKVAGPGYFLRSLDWQVYVDMTGTDDSLWGVRKVWYNGQLFDTLEAFERAWRDGSLKQSDKVRVDDGTWMTRARHGPERDLDDRAGPQSVSFDGARFRYDPTERYLSWMGFTTYLGFERDMGLAFWNIEFLGERIIYEMMPQEALAQYSGMDPSQSSTVWLDRAFGMGQLSRSLMRGYDCPSNALYIPTTLHGALGSVTQPDVICVFERDSGKPLSRHWATGRDEAGAVKGYEMVVRHVATVGNYDYLFDYTFQLDGSIEVRFSASGYIQGGYWQPGREDVGQRIRETEMGALHDHVINYKIDLDINGTRNSFHAMRLEEVDQDRAWFDEKSGWSSRDRAQRMTRETVRTERSVDYGTNAGGMFFVTNENSTNSWGTPRGYAIHPGASNIHLTNLGSERTLHNVEWAKHALHVTRVKDTEPYSSSALNINLPGRPPVAFGRFLNDESITQEDIVLWANLGTHHVIRSEDSPHTSTNIATSYLTLTPFNWGDSDAGMASRNAVRVNPRQQQARVGGWSSQGHIARGHCVPRQEKAFQYDGEMHLSGADDVEVAYHDLAMEAEEIHRLKAEL